MQLSSILKPEAVKVFAAASSKKRLFQEIGDVAAGCYDLNGSETVEALLERETLGPTGVGHGVALPHARLANLDEVVGVFVMLAKPAGRHRLRTFRTRGIGCRTPQGTGAGVAHAARCRVVRQAAGQSRTRRAVCAADRTEFGQGRLTCTRPRISSGAALPWAAAPRPRTRT